MGFDGTSTVNAFLSLSNDVKFSKLFILSFLLSTAVQSNNPWKIRSLIEAAYCGSPNLAIISQLKELAGEAKSSQWNGRMWTFSREQ